MTFIDWTIIAVFLIGLTLIGFLFSKSNRNLEDYFLGGRSMPTWLRRHGNLDQRGHLRRLA